MPRVLVVLEAGKAWPSGIVRGLIYETVFRKKGIEVQYVSRLIPGMEVARQRISSTPLAPFMNRPLTELNRFVGVVSDRFIVQMARRFDVVYLLKTSSCKLIRALRRSTSARLVFDLNDALWLPSFSGFAGNGLTEILATVDAVVSDNEYGMAYARQYNPNVYMVPEHPQVELFDAQRSQVERNPDSVVLGWIGSPPTVFNLFSIWEPLEELFRKHQQIHLRLVGVGGDPAVIPPFKRVNYSTLPYYSQADMVKEVLGMDIGLFPLFDVEDSYARGIMKATIYMSGGAATICSAVGANNRLIADGVNGLLARSKGEWLEKLETLVTQPEFRRKIALGGLELIRNNYTIEHSFGRLQKALFG